MKAISSGFGRGARTATVARVLRRLRFREAFHRTTMEFFRNTTMHGFRDLAERNVYWCDRLILAVLLILFIGWSIYAILLAWLKFAENPIYVSLSSSNYFNGNVPFPGIAVCANNKLSKTATRHYAQLLANKSRGSVSEDVFMEQLRYLGRLLDFEVDGYDSFVWLQSYLNLLDVADDVLWYDTYERMKRLSPTCQEMLLHCMWEGEERDCADMFQLRVTQEGFCCTFNYARSDTLFRNQRTEPIKTNLYGVENGLQLILNSSDADYYYPLWNNYGHSVLIFQPHDYPDISTGYLEQRFLKPNVETMVELFPRTLEATESLRLFRPSQRNCLFRDERKGYNGFYSQSECLLNCRLRSFVALCDCIPFFIPRQSSGIVISNNTPTCNLEHITCLNKYQIKMRTYYPSSGNITGLEKELQDSIDCGECLPLCNTVNYNVGTVSISMHATGVEALRNKILGEQGAGQNDSTPLALVKIYHANRWSSLYVQDVVSEWFNMLSSYGGQLGVCIGFSLMSLFELGYFGTWRLYAEIEKLYRNRNNKNRKTRRITPFQTVELNRPVYNSYTGRFYLP